MQSIQDLLKDKGIFFRVSSNDYVITCLNPDHDDSNPSCHINKNTGMYHCFACGYKGNIFRHFGILTNPVDLKVQKLKDKLKNLREIKIDLDYPEGFTPITEDFRGISAKTLKQFNAFSCYQQEELVGRICFPIKDIYGKILVFHTRHMHSDEGAKYLNYPKGIPLPIFPAKHNTKYKSLVLVEGFFDMLRLYDLGIENVSCVFGTNTLQKNVTLKLLPFKVTGITKIYLLLDNDDPGKEAAKVLEGLISTEGFEVENISAFLEACSVKDPGDLNNKQVMELKEYIK